MGVNTDIYFADIILPLNLLKLYTYSITNELLPFVEVGKRVIVQFGAKKFYTGIVKNIHNKKPQDYETKEIISVLDNNPLINNIQLAFWEWISGYYLCSLGDVYKAALPSGFKLESESLVLLNRNFSNFEIIEEKEEILLNILENRNSITIKEINTFLPQNKSLSLIKSLLDKGAINIEQKIIDVYKPKSEKYIQLNKEYCSEEKLNELFKKLEKYKKQTDLLMNYISLSNLFSGKIQKVKKDTLLKQSNVSSQILNTLIKKNIFFTENIEISRLKDYSEELLPANQLNEYQQKALYDIKEIFNNKDVVLLHGITSSGKTEIYIQLIKEYIQKGKQVLYLLPEIALTTQIINRLKKHFGNEIGVYHSKFSDSEKVEIWKNLIDSNSQKVNNYKIILGVRSSIFLPFSNLGLVVIDEEHENSFKQYDPSPRYNARDAAIYLSRLHNAKTLLGSATPSIESYFNAQQNKYGFVELDKRYLDIKLPKVIIADTHEATKKNLMKSHFTETLLENIQEALDEKKQVILFQNRRGFSPFLQCSSCGWIPKCKNCDVSLTYHKHINHAVCHYCGYSISTPDACHACGCFSMETKGFGTEKIEDEIAIFFPEAKVARMDLDTTRSRKSYENIIYDFETNKTNILIGTQMVTKGLDFDNVSIVGILNADNLLYYPDFRANERSFQLMTQVSGRAGRKNKQGKVIIQTSSSKHPVITDVFNNDYLNMYKTQIIERKQFKFPPFYRLVSITLKHKKIEVVNEASNNLAKELRKIFGKQILGPEFPLVKRISNLHLKNLLLKIDVTKSQIKAKELLIKELNKLKTIEKYKSLQIAIDVDPM